jgi:beta-N-acetylhexosaminidase
MMKRISWQDLSLREKIGQTVVSYSGGGLRKRSLEDLSKYPVGGAFVGAEVIKDANETTNKVQVVAEDIRRLREGLRIAPIICSDMENGCGTMIKGLTPFPHPMGLGATGSASLAYEYGKGTALEARSIGVNWTLSPVADLNQNRFNPVTNIRSVSDDPVRAKPILEAMVRGMQDHGLAATAKHFPGDGTDYRDQHLTVTRNSLTMDDWWKNHGRMFQALIDAGVYSIMTGHIALPAYQTKTAEGLYLPATLSHELSTRLLKDQMGFKGTIVSDALMMGGFMRGHEEKDRTGQEIDSFKAGTDLMLWPTEGYFDALEQAVESGEVPMSRLEDALTRIWAMKEKLGLFEENYDPFRKLTDQDCRCVAAAEKDTAEKSLTLLRDRHRQLPLSKDKIKKVLIVGITAHEETFKDFKILKEEFEARGMQVELKRNTGEDAPQEMIGDEFDLIFYAIHNQPHKPMGQLNFFGDQAWGIWWTLTAGVNKCVVVSFGSPYHFNEYFEMANVFINAYSPVPGTQRAVVRALFGEIPFQGTSPVVL